MIIEMITEMKLKLEQPPTKPPLDHLKLSPIPLDKQDKLDRLYKEDKPMFQDPFTTKLDIQLEVMKPEEFNKSLEELNKLLEEHNMLVDLNMSKDLTSLVIPIYKELKLSAEVNISVEYQDFKD
jgi:hypothetical protein